MAGLDADNFGAYTTAQILRWHAGEVKTGIIAVGSFGRPNPSVGPLGMRFSGAAGDRLVRVPAQAPSGDTAIFEFDLRISAYPASTSPFLWIYDGSTVQGTLDLTSSGEFQYFRAEGGGRTSLGSASTYVFPLNRHVHVGLKVVIDNSAGAVTVDIHDVGDETPVNALTLTSVDTDETASGGWTQYAYGNPSTGNTDWCNLRVKDGSGGLHDDLVGPEHVLALRPNANGDLSQWSRSFGVNQWATIDDIVSDDNATYNFTITDDVIDTLHIQDTPLPDQEIGFAILAHVAIGDATMQLKPVVRQGSTNTIGTAFTLTSAYHAYRTAYQEPPDSTPWSGGNAGAVVFNALQWGYQKPA